jgi:hypothetical protein
MPLPARSGLGWDLYAWLLGVTPVRAANPLVFGRMGDRAELDGSTVTNVE